MKSIIQRLLILMTISWAFASASAYDFEVDGIYYNITSMSELEVEVTYNTLDYKQKIINGSWHDIYYNNSYTGDINIPTTVNYNNRTFTVTSIGKNAFGGSVAVYGQVTPMPNSDVVGSKINSVTLPNTIKYIRANSFRECVNVSLIKLNNGLEIIEDCAFYNTSSLKQLDLPESLVNIGKYSISQSGITSLVIPNSVEELGDYSCFNNTKLTSIIIGSSVKTVGSSALSINSSLIEVFCLPPNKPDKLQQSTFGGAHQYLEIYVPSTKVYGFGHEYLSFPTTEYDYSGLNHNIEWTNNLKAYKCTVSDSEIKTEINAGSYTKYLTATYSDGVDFSVDIPFEYTINKAPLSLTVQDAQKEYGEPNPVFTCNISGFVNGETEQSIGATPTFDCEATLLSNVGTYRILASLIAPNYEISYNYGTLNVLKAPITVGVVNTSKIYGNPNPGFELFYSGMKNDETAPVWDSKPDVTTTATKESSVGSYAINVAGGDTKNYSITSYVPGNLTITKAPLEMAVNDVTRVYYEENPKFTYRLIGLKNNDNTDCITEQPNFICEALVNSDCGEYSIVANNALSTNYELTYKPGTLKITQAPLTVQPDDLSREYGDENPTLTFSAIGLRGEDSVEEVFTTIPTLTTNAKVESNVGDYIISSGSGSSKNYSLTYKQGKLTITKAPLIATVINSEKIYGDINPDFTCKFIGLKLSDTGASSFESMPLITSTATIKSPAGDYPIEITSNGYARNYEIKECISGILTINKRDLTTKADDCERLYGEDNPKFEISYDGFVNGDNTSNFTNVPTAECSATKDSNAGTYPITVSGGSADNYTFIYQNGSLKVNPLNVGFEETYNSVVYNDMSKSSTDDYFNYIPEITGPFSEDDFWLELWFLDGDNSYSNHVATISGGEYAGKYVNTNSDRPMYAGKYIFNLVSKGINPNVVANPSRAYVTVTRASTNLEWDTNSPIIVGMGEKVDLGINYQADLWCSFNTEYDDELIALSAEGETGNNPHWYATGLKEGETTLYFSIECKKNDMGFYDFSDSRTMYKKIKVVDNGAGVDDINADTPTKVYNVYNLQGMLILKTDDSERIKLLPTGIYIINGKKVIIK